MGADNSAVRPDPYFKDILCFFYADVNVGIVVNPILLFGLMIVVLISFPYKIQYKSMDAIHHFF